MSATPQDDDLTPEDPVNDEGIPDATDLHDTDNVGGQDDQDQAPQDPEPMFDDADADVADVESAMIGVGHGQ